MFNDKNQDSGIYFSLEVSSETMKKIQSFCKNILNLDMTNANSIYSNKMHASIFASRNKNKPHEHYNQFVDDNLKIFVKAKEWKILTSQNSAKKCLAIVIDSPDLERIHQDIKEKTGLNHAFPDFLTHITIHYDFQGTKEDLKELPLPDFSIELTEMFSKPYYVTQQISINRNQEKISLEQEENTSNKQLYLLQKIMSEKLIKNTTQKLNFQ